MRITHDPWQAEFLKTKGDKILCCGRQVGKSEICSEDSGDWASKNGNCNILMIAPTERQAYSLFNKTLDYLVFFHPKMICKGKDRPTKTRIKLTNKTTIYCLPTGTSGMGIRFLTVHRLYVDEASRVPEEVWAAVTPMLLTTGGDTIILSTPKGNGNEFAFVVQNKDGAYDSFTRFTADSETVVRERKICETWTEQQRDKALELLARERKRKTTLVYAQEYEGKIVDKLRQLFPTSLIRSCMTIARGEVLPPSSSSGYSKYLGVDVAGMGEDLTALVSLQRTHKKLEQIDQETRSRQRTTETITQVLTADKRWNYKRIDIDDGGMGVGVFDHLLVDAQTKRKVVAINNASRSIDREDRNKKLLKEDLYMNLLVLMEQGSIALFDDAELLQSLMSVQAEQVASKYDEETGRSSSSRIKIFGRDTHLTEALIRAAWGATRKRLSIWIA